MPRYLLILPMFLLAGFAVPAVASRVIVPTEVPTIQAAIDSGADSIGVLDGVTPERLTVTRFVVIEPVIGSRPFLGIWSSTPLVRSLQIVPRDPTHCCDAGILARGIRFLGKVDASTLYNGGSITFEACRFDSGFTGPAAGIQTSFANLSVRGCIFLGDASLSGYVQFVGNTVIGGTLRVRADGVHDIRDNYVQGPAAVGMDLHLQESIGQVIRNSIHGTTDGIRLVGNGNMSASQNDIADCSGNGIDKHSLEYGGAFCDSNSIVRCAGTGIIVRADTPLAALASGLKGNRIQQVGHDGIDLGDGIAALFRGNVILDAAGNGLTAGSADSCESNVIGRCGGAGIRLTEDPYRIVGNTIFSNTGPGLHFNDAYAGEVVAKNIAVFNGGPGLLFEGTHFPQLSCNDWFGNSGGQTVGIPPSYADIAINPRFCDLGGGDVHLSASSPLLNDPNCGLIGALGLGCGATTEVPQVTSSAATTFHAWPVPAQGAVSFSVTASSSPIDVELFDVTGTRRWRSTIPAGRTSTEWDRRGGSGQLAPPGVYFARFRQKDKEVGRARVILTK